MPNMEFVAHAAMSIDDAEKMQEAVSNQMQGMQSVMREQKRNWLSLWFRNLGIHKISNYVRSKKLF
jgi:hypothetical protein